MEVREIKEGDLECGFLDTLNTLRPTDLKSDAARRTFEDIRANPNHTILVALEDKTVVGSITVLIEPKFIHGGSFVCHIEDVVVRTDMRKKGVGRLLIKRAQELAVRRGCYKTILDCADDVKEFYERLGFTVSGHAMRTGH